VFSFLTVRFRALGPSDPMNTTSIPSIMVILNAVLTATRSHPAPMPPRPRRAAVSFAKAAS